MSCSWVVSPQLPVHMVVAEYWRFRNMPFAPCGPVEVGAPNRMWLSNSEASDEGGSASFCAPCPTTKRACWQRNVAEQKVGERDSMSGPGGSAWASPASHWTLRATGPSRPRSFDCGASEPSGLCSSIRDDVHRG